MGCLLWLAITYCFGLSAQFLVSEAWPIDYSQQDDSDYPPTYGRENGDIADWTPEEMQDQTNNVLPELSLEDIRHVIEMAEQHEASLPVANFRPVGPDPTNNGGAGPFKFVKPTTPAPVVQTLAPAPVKKHIATISDETPLYLNYAEKEDAGQHRPVAEEPKSEGPTKTLLGELNKTLILLPESDSRPSLLTILAEAQARQAQLRDADADAENSAEDSQVEDEVVNRPEIDFTQRVAFPDLSGADVQPVRLTEAEQDEEAVEQEAAAAGAQQQPDNETGEQEESAPVEETENDSEPDTGSEERDQPTPVSSTSDPSLAMPADAATDPLVVHVIGAPAPQHLAVPNDISFIPSPEYGFLLKTVGEKRSQESSVAQENGGKYSLGMVLGLSVGGCVLAATVGAALLHRRNSRKQASADAEEPSYGVTGPGPVKPTFLDLSGDRSLAKSAETYHYQHQKRQILSSVENNPSSGGSTATPRSGDHSDYDSDEEEEEGEDYGDYTVYECPGLAPPGEIEVLNPMFSAAKDATGSGANDK